MAAPGQNAPAAGLQPTPAEQHHGHAFGIAFRSHRPMPELGEPRADDTAAAAVDIDWQPPRAQVPLPGGGICHFDGQCFALSVPAICDFEVTPRRIAVHPAPQADAADIRAFLLGSAMGALLHLRGTLVFHGSAVVRPDGTAALFCGHSTAGKSTLAATLSQHGHAALADDLSALAQLPEGRPLVLPGLARTKLWRDALDRLGWAGQAGPGTRVQPGMDKHCLPVTTATQPAPLSSFYELQVDEDSQSPLTISPILGVDKITVMLRHVYRSNYLQAMGRQNQLLAAVAALAPHVQMHRITRPRSGDTLPAIVDWLHAHWTEGSA